MSLLSDTIAFMKEVWGDIDISPTRIKEWERELADPGGRTPQQLRNDIMKYVVGRDRVAAWAREQFSSRGLEIGTANEDAGTRIGRIVDELMSGKRGFYELETTLNEYGTVESPSPPDEVVEVPDETLSSPEPAPEPVPEPEPAPEPEPVPTATVDKPGIVRPPWMTNAMFREWKGYYLEAGGAGTVGSEQRATDQFRASDTYESYFPGIKRDDGIIRYENNPEATYFANIAAYKQAVTNAGLNPRIFGEEYIDLIRGDTSPAEFEQRVNALHSRVMDGGDMTRNWYAENMGLVPTNAAILAGLMSSEVNDAILNKQITMAEIGGQAALRDFDIGRKFSEMLQQQGMDKDIADRFFGSADRMLPVLNALALRHADPDDDFSLKEYADAEFFDNAAQSSRIDRLKAQEESLFTGSKQSNYQLSQKTGGISGLGVV